LRKFTNHLIQKEKNEEARQADAQDLEEIKKLEEELKKRKT
jgi:hypothetical protein